MKFYLGTHQPHWLADERFTEVPLFVSRRTLARYATMPRAVAPWSLDSGVWQSAYGHAARKRTWLLYVGDPPAPLDWRREAGTHQVGWFDRAKPTLGKAAAKATPPAFRDALLALVRGEPEPVAQR